MFLALLVQVCGGNYGRKKRSPTPDHGPAQGPVHSSGPVHGPGLVHGAGPVHGPGPVHSPGPVPGPGPVHTQGYGHDHCETVYKEVCEKVPVKTSRVVLVPRCSSVPRQSCVDTTRKVPEIKCIDVPRQSCSQVPRQVKLCNT